MLSTLNNSIDFEIGRINNENFDNNSIFISTNSFNNIPMIFQDNPNIPIMNSHFSENQTDNQISIYYKRNEENFIYNENNNEDYEEYKYYPFNEILEILKKRKILKNKTIFFKINQFIKDAEERLSNKKRKRETFFEKFLKKENNNNNFIELKEDKKDKKRGRKCKENLGKETHTKMSSDNIIKKIKAKIIHYLVIFMNNILDNDKFKFYKLNYKYIDQLNKKNDLDLLEKTVKDLLSMEITSKVKKVEKNFNKILIKKIVDKEISVRDYNTTMFIFNMKLRDWIPLFTFKKNIVDIIKEKGGENVNSKQIEENLVHIDALLNKMLGKNDPQYLSSFIFYLFNYERWFYIKFGRKKKSKIADNQ